MEILNNPTNKKVSYTVGHNDKKYKCTDHFEGAKIMDTIIRDKYGNTVEDAALMEIINRRNRRHNQEMMAIDTLIDIFLDEDVTV